ncbi:MAG: hypothetical protein Q9164_004930 [Protoblastenia rupestris]
MFTPPSELAELYDVASFRVTHRVHRPSKALPACANMAKTIIVTGASKGDDTESLHRIIELTLSKALSDHPSQVRTVAGDLNDFSLAQHAVECAVKEFGQLDGLVVNHGAMFGVNKVAEADIDEWRKMFDINFFSAVAFTKAALPVLRKTGGCIVFTSSGASTGVYSSWGAYSASKSAMNALARQIACEEPDVTAFSIRPGVVDTDMQRDLREIHSAVMEDKDNAKFRDAYQNQTLLKPEQPGNVMARLVLDPDKSLNGQYLSWDGKELSKYQS